MILFKSDWEEKHKGAIYHIETKNQSFLKVSATYKKMGIENHLFPLALHDRELRKVNIHTETSNEIIARVMIEASINPWYIFREVMRIPSPAGANNMPFKANVGNIGMYWLFFNHVTFLAIQPRQTGKTTGLGGLCKSCLSFLSRNTKIHLITKDNGLRVETIDKIKGLEHGLPPYLQFINKKDANNTETITVNEFNNKLITSVAQASIRGAIKIGRGYAVPINLIDEGPYVTNVKHTLPAAFSAANAAADIAKEANQPYCNGIATTAGRLNEESGVFMHGIYKNGLRFTEKLFDIKDEKTLHRIVRKHSKSNPDSILDIVILEKSHQQLGFTNEWLYEKMRRSGSSGMDARCDYLNEWVHSGSDPVFDKELEKKLNDSLDKNPYDDISEFEYITRWYLKPGESIDDLRNVDLTAGLDTSDAIGNDDIALIIRRNDDGSVVCAGNFNETNTHVFSQWLATFFTRFLKLVLIFERRSTGTAILNNLIIFLTEKGIDPFKRIFNWIVNDSNIRPDVYKEIDIKTSNRSQAVYDKYKKQFGFATSGSGRTSRSKLYGEVLISSIEYTGDAAKDKQLIDQVTGLTKKNGRIDHDASGNDDLVIAWLLSYWYLALAKNIDIYGHDPRNVMSQVIITSSKAKNKIENDLFINEQKEKKHELNGLLLELENTKSDVQIEMLLNKIKRIKDSVDSSVIQTLNLDQVLEDVMIKKQNKRNSFLSYTVY